jgi:TRAP-type C4-dicarboxylate transport system substrate-binding protein
MKQRFFAWLWAQLRPHVQTAIVEAFAEYDRRRRTEATDVFAEQIRASEAAVMRVARKRFIGE